MYSKVTVAPMAALSEFETSLNEFGELAISAKDADGVDISIAGLIIPSGPFSLVYNPITKDWGVIPLRDYPSGYQLVETIIGVE